MLRAKWSDMSLAVFYGCLMAGTFPDLWNIVRIVLLYKWAGRPVMLASSFCPFCILDSAGKLPELLILQRLSAFVAETGGLASYQYGFRPGISNFVCHQGGDGRCGIHGVG